MKTIEVNLYASLRPKIGNKTGKGVVELDDEATLTDLLNKLDIPAEMSQMTLINGETCPPEEQWRSNKKLEEGQVVAVFPPLAGG